MADAFLSSEEYDERAHRLYESGEYDAALEVLREGVGIYPHSVELFVGLGYTRVAREEYVWARHAFERALVLDPEHEDAQVGLGEALLRFGQREAALALFDRVLATTGGEDLDLLLSMGRALYREGLLDAALRTFTAASSAHPTSADVSAALGYTVHRQGDEAAALRHLRRALHLDAEHHESRIFLAHSLYDRGEWSGALREFERVPPAEHCDVLALARLIELKTAVEGARPGSPALACWEARLAELNSEVDPVELLLAEVEERVEQAAEAQADGASSAGAAASPPAGPAGALVRVDVRRTHCVRLPDGCVLSGSWQEIVAQLRDAAGTTTETLAQFMRRRSAEIRAATGQELPAEDAETFVVAGARAGCWRIEY
jgi:Flp pilus assembly protein TadD